MSTPIFIHVKKFIRPLKRVLVLAFMLFCVPMHAGWDVDFSRRSQGQSAAPMSIDATEKLGPSAVPVAEKNIFDRVFDSVVPTQDVVILHTEQGFIPSTVRVKEGAQYRIYVVNVNEKARNVSFVLDSFSEHHATFYGQIKSFYIQPKKDGVFTFISPETSAQGRLVVHPAKKDGGTDSNLNVRAPATAD